MKTKTLTFISNTGKTEKVKMGFSWGTALVSFFAPLYRKDFTTAGCLFVAKVGLIMFLTDAGIVGLTSTALCLLLDTLVASQANVRLAKVYLDKGYQIVPDDEVTKEATDMWIGFETAPSVWY